MLQDLGFLSFTLPEVEILMPTKKPRGAELTLEQDLANQALHQRRLRIEHVNSSVKRCRMVKDRIRLWKEGVRDLVMELCCALHNFRVRHDPMATDDLIGINSNELLRPDLRTEFPLGNHPVAMRQEIVQHLEHLRL